ncbi:RING-H2 finger protein ATL22-like [Impatiens glandulifera]|uniref:RING-H2 finger protein ATL22-like n=1 Tax=Impatiens glandulifera TaxID=253017 RepID=UPI001FB19900|nr:RING-H2 finger protein ATL22-like [Impatiens glandulifera]
MEFNHERILLIFFLAAVVFSSLQPSVGRDDDDDCRPVQCRKGGPIVRFPFRLKDRQPQHCGYPGFDLSCSDFNEPILSLPDSVQFYIKQINYTGKFIHVQEQGGCLARIRYLNLSSSQFDFSGSSRDINLTIFSCPSSSGSGDLELDRFKTCLDDPDLGRRRMYYAMGSDWSIDLVPILSCTKMYNVSGLPSNDVLFKNYDLTLDWPPLICGDCDSQRKYCRFVNNSLGNQTECYGHIELPNRKTGKLH